MLFLESLETLERNKDLGVTENVEEEEVPAVPLLDVPDEQLDEAGLKQNGLDSQQLDMIVEEGEKRSAAIESGLNRYVRIIEA